jgi:hypothetical protein
MSGTALDPKVRRRRLLVRAALVLVYAGLMGLVFVRGKGHTIQTLTVSVDGQEPIDLAAGERDQAKVQGQGHRVVITVKGQKVERRITVPLSEEMLLLSLPKLLAGVQPAVTPFVPPEAPPADDQQGQSNAFTSPADPNATPGAPSTPPAP